MGYHWSVCQWKVLLSNCAPCNQGKPAVLENRSKVSREFLDKFQQSCKCRLQLSSSSSHLLNICIVMITAIKDQGHLLKYLIMSRHGLWQNSLFLQQVPEEGVRGIQRVMTTHCLISQNIFIDYDHCTVSFHLLYNYSWTASAACPGTAVCKMVIANTSIDSPLNFHPTFGG